MVKEKIDYVGEIADSVAEVAAKIENALESLDSLGNAFASWVDSSYSTLIRIVNMSDHTVEFLSDDFDHGTWSSESFDLHPPAYIESREARLCLAVDKGFWTGNKGNLQYRKVDDSTNPTTTHFLSFSWDNPSSTSFWSGGNDASAADRQVKGPKVSASTEFRAIAPAPGSGKRIKVTFYIYPRSVSLADIAAIQTLLLVGQTQVSSSTAGLALARDLDIKIPKNGALRPLSRAARRALGFA